MRETMVKTQRRDWLPPAEAIENTATAKTWDEALLPLAKPGEGKQAARFLMAVAAMSVN